MSFTNVTLTGTVTLQNGQEAAGATVQLLLSQAITDGTSVIQPEPQTVQANGSGVFSITVPANDDSTTLPTGTFYKVTIVAGGEILQFNVVVPHADAPTVDLFTLAQLVNPSPASIYVHQLVAGSGVTLSPAGGTGIVTVSAAALNPPPAGITGNDAYDPVRCLYNANAALLSHPRAALTKAFAGTGLGRIFCIGDSTTAGTGSQPSVGSYPYFLRQLLSHLGFTVAGTGIALANPALDPPYPDSRWSTTGTITTSFQTFQAWNATNNGTFVFASDEPGTNVFIYYSDQNDPWTYSIDGGGATTVTPGSTFALKRIAVTGLSNATHTVTLTHTSSSSVGPVLYGIEVTNEFGFSVTNLGLPGLTTAQCVGNYNPSSPAAGADPLRFIYALSSLSSGYAPPDLAFVCLGLNDANTGVPTSTYIANMTTIIQALQNVGCAVVLVVPMAPSVSSDSQLYAISTATWTAYRQAMYTLADSVNGLNVPLIDMSDRGGLWATANGNGLMYSVIANVNGTVSGSSVTNWVSTKPPFVGAQLLGQAGNGDFVASGITGIPGSWNFTTTGSGTTGTGTVQVGETDGFHPNPSGYAFMAEALVSLLST